ncbi:MAG TPA: HDOD domain-containing protein [Candidatus Competibacteraceae bacterium]|nr:HDOD domain-containing protein [Candidatus Competibacteraceae bacterium]MCP5132113.1 HDOD domain-containing protein [Gammaproteobacteria bacterium]HPF58956.1 HDOD domain-containing protein [Candidatus Competibacteraceae bacterium]HRY16780.1 HDOD domain-containing protein [Candidatus Competibacteraceae bacterium]
MVQQSLQDLIIKALASENLQLPALPTIAVQLQHALRDRNTKVADLEKMIVGDQALASQVLRVANSSFYRGLQRINTIQKAIIRLGVRKVAMLAMAVSQRSLYLTGNPQIGLYMERLWQHAFAAAQSSQWLANHCGCRTQADDAFMAGLLHNIGQLVILQVIDELSANKQLGSGPLPENLLNELLNSNMHNAMGYVLMKRWNLPDEYCIVARDHHREPYDSDNILLTIVRLADQACEKLGIGLRSDSSIALAATPEAQALGLGEIVLTEVEILLEDSVTMAG